MIEKRKKIEEEEELKRVEEEIKAFQEKERIRIMQNEVYKYDYENNPQNKERVFEQT